jgi:hypothetical protein
MPAKNKAKPIEVYRNDTLPIVFVDAIQIGRRKDGLIYLSFATQIPDYIMEQVRLVVNDESLHMMVDELCQITDYFPEKPAKKTRRPSK